MSKEIKEEEEKSLLLENTEEFVADTREWNDDETRYLSNLRKRLSYARDQREASHEEFDDLSYSDHWLQNERLANTYIPPKNNKAEISVQTGTLRKKLKDLVSAIITTNLSAEYMAFDKNDVAIHSYGVALGDIKEKTDDLDEDDEKKWLRIYELFKQGTIFIQEIWKDETVTEKKLGKEFDGKFSFNDWSTNQVTKAGRPTREILDGRSVFLGNLKKYFSTDQPYIFTLETKTYEELEPIFCGFENWKYVPRKKRTLAADSQTVMLTSDWTLEDHPDGTCELIKYQDAPNNEYQIIINGIPMLPMGFPLPWGRRYNIDQQNFDPIRHDFSYGRAFPFDNKNLTQLLDEMLKLMVLKSYKSFAPPYVNNTGRVIPSTVFMPGRMNLGLGITKDNFFPLDPNQALGVNQSEFNMTQSIRQTIDDKTSSQTFGGGTEGNNTTATQINETQKQAMIMLGTILLADTLMEQKIGTSRLLNLLQNWFNPIDKVADEARNALVNQYRIVSKETTISGTGRGVRYVVPSKVSMDPEHLQVHEDKMSHQMGKPVRILLINPDILEQAGLMWQTIVTPKQKKSSDYNKVMFGQMVTDGKNLGLNFDMNYIQEEFAEVWEKDPAKLFSKTPPPATAVAGGGAPGNGGGGMIPNKINPPKMTIPTPTGAPPM